ncbi:MAG TPA: ATP-binding protein [Anaerolineae bacterium]|nr:ATP-binding protein [Anaerolineae bacterium]
MNRLWVRLTLAFALVVLIGIGAVAVLADVAIGRGFRDFIARYEASLQSSALATELVTYFETHQTWAGVDRAIAEFVPERDRVSGPPASGPGRRRAGPQLLVADAAGRIVYDNYDRRVNEFLSNPERQVAAQLQSGQDTIGYLAMLPGPSDSLRPEERTFIEGSRRNLVVAALVAGGVAIVFGVAFSRGLAQPLNRLAAAAHAIAANDLSQRVEPGGAAEVVEVGHAFNEMAASLEKAERLRRNLVADVAHELRTPLSVLQGNLSGLLDGVFPLEMAEVARLYDETRLLNRLVEDLRELAQAEAGQLRLDLRPIDVSAIVRSTVEAFSAAASEQQVTLTGETASELPPVVADAERVAQVLRNLLSNALRHTPAGGKIEVSASHRAGWVEVSVSDTGEGIAAGDLPHVFDRFWRGDKSRGRETGGSGLGLAIARRLIEAQRGQIGVESQVGQGSRFWLRLPRQ